MLISGFWVRAKAVDKIEKLIMYNDGFILYILELKNYIKRFSIFLLFFLGLSISQRYSQILILYNNNNNLTRCVVQIKTDAAY